MVETDKHKQLKKKARRILLDEGYTEDEIQEEYRINNIIIDVVGIKEDNIIAIECGNLQPNRSKQIKKIFPNSVFINLKYDIETKRYGTGGVNVNIDAKVWEDFLIQSIRMQTSASKRISLFIKEELNTPTVEIVERKKKNEIQ